jgi:hypothetical protein
MTTTDTDWLAVARKAAGDTLAAIAALETVPTVGAAPKVELPVEPGIYLDADGDPWKLDTDGDWYFGGDYHSEAEANGSAPFTRLAPEADTAKKIATALRNRSNGFAGGCETVAPIGNGVIVKAADWIEAEFGVTS